MSESWQKLTKAEFDAWLDANRAHLHRSVAHFCEPPTMCYYDTRMPVDAAGGHMVAREVLYESYSKSDPEPYRWAPNTFAIKRVRKTDEAGGRGT